MPLAYHCVVLLSQVEKHAQRVPISQRGGEVVEPLVSTQWFLKMDGMASQALDVVRSGQVKIMPDMFEKIWCVDAAGGVRNFQNSNR